MKKAFKKIISMLLITALVFSSGVFGLGASLKSYAASSTGVGLSEFAMTAYYEDWTYVYGAMSYGCVDCSGLIMLYNGVGGSRTSMCQVASDKGSISSLPRIHGLGLWQPGHVGVYVGSGMAVDARDEEDGVCYQSVYSKNWQMWFKVVGVSYPTNGWETFNGNKFYYEDGEYLVNTSRTIDGVTYTFGSAGTIVSAVSGGQNVDVGSVSGNNTTYQTASSSSSYSSSSSTNSSSSSSTAQSNAAAEAEKQRLAEEAEKKRQEEEAEAERQAAVQRLADAKAKSAASYLTLMTVTDPYSSAEPQSVAISATSDTKELKTESSVNTTQTAAAPVSTVSSEATESETTVTMQRSLNNEINDVTTAKTSTNAHPLMFFIIIFAAAASLFVLMIVIKKLKLQRNY